MIPRTYFASAVRVESRGVTRYMHRRITARSWRPDPVNVLRATIDKFAEDANAPTSDIIVIAFNRV